MGVIDAQRSVAQENSDFGKLAGLDQQRAKLAEQQKKLAEPVMKELSTVQKAQETLKTDKEYLAEKLDKRLITESKYNKLTGKIDHEITINDGVIKTFESILKSLATTITEDFLNIAGALDNAKWAIDGANKNAAIADLEAYFAGNISSLELDTRGATRNVTRAQADRGAVQNAVDAQRARVFAEAPQIQQAALVRLGMKTDVPFAKQLDEILNTMSPKFLEDAAKSLAEQQPGVSKFLMALSELDQTTDDAVTATQSVLEAEKERADKLKENAASYRDFAISLRDFYRSLEDIQIERQRFAEDFPREVADVFLSVNRSARDLTEQYDDFIGNLDKNILQTQLEVAQLDKQIKNTKLRNDVRSKFAPGSQGFGTDLANLYLDYIDSLESEEEIGLQKNIKRLDVEDQILQFSRQIRDLSEQRESFERDRLEQLRGLLRQQEDYNLEQQRTWEDTLEQWHGIEIQAEELGISLGVTANDVQTEGTNLVSAIATLSTKILEISDRLYAESKIRSKEPPSEGKQVASSKQEVKSASLSSSSPYSASALESLREPPVDNNLNFLDRVRRTGKGISETLDRGKEKVGELLFGKPANANTVPAGAKFDFNKEAEEIQRRADENRKKNKKKKSESNPTPPPAPVTEYKVPKPVQKVIDYGVNTPGGQAIGKVWKAVDVVTDEVPIIKDIKNQAPNVVNNVTKGVQTFIKDPVGTTKKATNEALVKFGETPVYDWLNERNREMESLKKKAGEAIKKGDDAIENVPVVGDIYKGGKDALRNLNKWNPFNRSSLEKPLNFAWGNEMMGNEYATLGNFYEVAGSKEQVANDQSKLATRYSLLANLTPSVAAPDPTNLIKKEDIEKLESQTKQESLPVLEPSVDFSQKEAEVKEKQQQNEQLLEVKFQKETEVLDLNNEKKRRDAIDNMGQKLTEMDDYFLQQQRESETQSYKVTKQAANAKGYLTVPEQIKFAGGDVAQEYQNQINSISDRITAMERLSLDFQGFIYGFTGIEYKDDPEVEKQINAAIAAISDPELQKILRSAMDSVTNLEG
ncbi:MAG: hypothetical protein ACRCZS_19825, partial [Chroococcidiopsis sp.]